ncbi:MAG: sulfurtransferase [Balneolales bacterium]
MKPIISVFGLLILVACDPGNHEKENYPNANLLTDVEWIQENLHRNDLRIIDMRSEGFEGGHIPGAVNIKGANVLVDNDHAVTNFLVPPLLFEKMMGDYGIGNEHTVVIYDDGNGLHASRLFYALELYGHDDVKILNGGFSAWKEQDGEISTSRPNNELAIFRANTKKILVCDIAYIQQNIGNDHVILYDARSRDEYEGNDNRAEHGGHIPGAVHLEWSESIQNEDVPYFKTAVELQELLGEKGITPDKEIIPYCQSNVRGAHVYYTLRLMGYDKVRPYEGSWSEYGNTEGVPIQN